MIVADKRNEKWRLGDVLVTKHYISLIVKDNNENYCLMNIGFDGFGYSTDKLSIFGKPYKSLENLYQKAFPIWHKVNAKLVIE